MKLKASCNVNTIIENHMIYQLLLKWYDQYHRKLPWRAPMGVQPNPYHVWISEIMLQQTTVGTVKGYFEKFLHKWPTVHDLARASLDELLHAWQGLGYYARARNMHACAKVISSEHKGVFPDTAVELEKLPGVGPYTAAAIAAIAFNETVAVVDTNVERIVSRLYCIPEFLPAAKISIRAHVQELTPAQRPGDFAQAMMDLGSSICIPKNPLCVVCPLKSKCQAFQENRMEEFPKRLPKVNRPIKYGNIFWITNERNQVLIRQRPLKGLLGGLMEFPSSVWETEPPILEPLFENLTIDHLMEKPVEHTFTHFHLILQVVPAKTMNKNLEGIWVNSNDLKNYAFPTLMKKVIKLVQDSIKLQ